MFDFSLVGAPEDGRNSVIEHQEFRNRMGGDPQNIYTHLSSGVVG
jgi:hypothetical protein